MAELAVFAAITNPAISAPVRFRNEYSNKPTALAKPFTKERVIWSDSNQPVAANRQLATTQMLFFQFKDVLRNRIRYDPNPTAAIWKYQWYFGWNANGPINNITVPIQSEDVHVSFGLPDTIVTSYAPHGDFLAAGESEDGERYMWVDGTSGNNSTIVVTWSADPGATGRIALFRWDEGKETYMATATTVAGTLIYTFNIATSDYYMIKINNTVAPFTASIYSQGTCSVWAHHYLPGVYDNSDELTGIRMTSASTLWKNEAAEINKSGLVVDAQYGKGEEWTAISRNTDPFTYLLSTQGNRDFLFNNGTYGFSKSSEEQEYEMQRPFTIAAWGAADSCFKLVSPYSFYVCCANVTLSDGRDTYINSDYHIEFTSNNTWFDHEMPTMSPNQWKGGMEMVASVEQFYPNSTHWRDILRGIGKLAKVSAPLLALIPRAGPGLSAAASTVGDVFQVMGKKRRR